MIRKTDRLTYRDAPHLRILKPKILRHTKFILRLHLIVDNADIPNSFPLILTTPDPWLGGLLCQALPIVSKTMIKFSGEGQYNLKYKLLLIFSIPSIYEPVCGKDSKTYSSRCNAECSGVAVDCEGECPCRSCKDDCPRWFKHCVIFEVQNYIILKQGPKSILRWWWKNRS